MNWKHANQNNYIEKNYIFNDNWAFKTFSFISKNISKNHSPSFLSPLSSYQELLSIYRVRSWNNDMHCMSLYILLVYKCSFWYLIHRFIATEQLITVLHES